MLKMQHLIPHINSITSIDRGMIDFNRFGNVLLGRSIGVYRYGFNGEELIDEQAGEGMVYDLGARFYDARLGRMFSLDQLMIEYPWQSPYTYCYNNPIWILDVKGMGGDPIKHTVKKGETLWGVSRNYYKKNKESIGTSWSSYWNSVKAWNYGGNYGKIGGTMNLSDPNNNEIQYSGLNKEMCNYINFKPNGYFKGEGEEGNNFGFFIELPGIETEHLEFSDRFWEFYSGDGWANMVYGPENPMTQGVKRMESVSKARQYFYNKYKSNIFSGSQYHFGESVTGYQGTWDLKDVWTTGNSNWDAQYVGSCAINVFVSQDCKNLIFVVANSTSSWSFFGHAHPKSWNQERSEEFISFDSNKKKMFSTIYNLYIWSEPIIQYNYNSNYLENQTR